MAINYFSEDIEFELSNATEVTSWVRQVITTYHFDLEELNYIFCSDEYLLAINREYLQHDYYTDIVSFDNSEAEKEVCGDLFISVDRIRDNAKCNNVSFENELHRVMIHGVLHLLGFNDKTEEEKSVMRRKEDSCLSLLSN